MLIIFIAIILGFIIGMFMPMPTSQALALYFSVGIFAALDSVIGGCKALLKKDYNSKIFISGFFFNSFLAMVLAYVGDKLGLPLYYAAIFVFGTRLFTNISEIRRCIILNHESEKNIRIRNKKYLKRLYVRSLRKKQSRK